MATTHALLKSARAFHLYTGVFFAPALLFFAFTGGVQTFSFHETTKGSTYKPPAILVELGQLHKKQTIVVPQRKADPKPEAKAAPKPEAPKPEAPTPPAPPQKTHNLLPMKIFFLFVAISLFCSTLTGLYMAYKFARRTSVITATLLAGIAIPLLLLLF
jgi:hypothetical protein